MQVVHLTDSTGKASAEISVSKGFNCYRLQLEHDGRQVELLWAAEDFPHGEGRPSGSGIPILFPFPGRIAGGSFRWDGVEYELERNDPRGNAIHGFVYTRPWRVRQATADNVVAEFQASVDDPELASQWPSDFLMTADYQLHSDRLSTRYAVANCGTTSLPFGLGLHPYFRVPLATADSDDSARVQVQVPITEHWMLDGLIPTGEIQKSDRSSALAKGMRVDDMQFDDVFGAPLSDGGKVICRMDQSNPNINLEISYDDQFQTCVVYNPPHREAICIEPYTCVPNPFDLEERGIKSGLNVLEPGESREFAVEYRLVD